MKTLKVKKGRLQTMGKKSINQFQPSNSIRAHLLPLVLNYNCEHNWTEMNDKIENNNNKTKNDPKNNNKTNNIQKQFNPQNRKTVPPKKKCGFHFKLNKLTGILAFNRLQA